MPLNTDTLYILDSDVGLQSEPYDESKLVFSSALRQLLVANMPIEYKMLSEAPHLFLAPSVMALIGEDMLDVFPLSVRNGEVLKRGSYPTKEELEAWLDTTLLPLNLEKERELLAIYQAEGGDIALYCERAGCNPCTGCSCGLNAVEWYSEEDWA